MSASLIDKIVAKTMAKLFPSEENKKKFYALEATRLSQEIKTQHMEKLKENPEEYMKLLEVNMMLNDPKFTTRFFSSTTTKDENI